MKLFDEIYHRYCRGRDVPLILADNVARYYWELSNKEIWDLGTDFPGCRAPFKETAVEFKNPRTVWSSEKGRYRMDAAVPDHVVVLVRQRAIPGSRDLNLLCAVVPQGSPYFLSKHINVFMLLRQTEDGQIIPHPDGGFDATSVQPEALQYVRPFCHQGTTDGELGQIFQGLARSFVHITLLTFTFMNCRNVDVKAHAIPERLAKKHLKQHGLTSHKYYVLEIDSLTRRVKALRQSGEASTKGQALHLCRGHFKTFTVQKPLLGKHVGTYWWDHQVRGSADEGTIHKDYQVKAGVS